MPTASASPLLPVELLLSIFSRLRPHDLAQVCKANSHLRAVARPLFYHFGTFTKFGLHFPGAASPYPFLHLPEIGTGFDDSELEALVPKIKKLTIPSHNPSECAIYQNLQLGPVPNEVEALRIECFVRILGDSEDADLTGDLPHTQPWPEVAGDEGGVECYHCAYPCQFISPLLSSMCADKVVLRNPPLGARYTAAGECLWSYEPSQELVVVLNSEPVSYGLGYASDCNGTSWGIRPFWCAQKVTIVLWTGSPDAEWIPACMNAPHCFDPFFDPPKTKGPDGEKKGYYCEAMKMFWRDLGFQIGRSPTQCTTLRIVNITNTVESFRYGSYGQHSANRRIRDTSSVEDNVRAGANVKSSKKSKRKSGEDENIWEGVVQFLSMEEWIAMGEWEDVFTRKEMAPFLTAAKSSATPLVQA
ncbi:hypothetical protein A1Q2_05798 [Trichosporon asahii var. asahii CBS 8904]|uniref:F-box domain-containing protein n=1 Tax=Trichosporon asahii var. asahii (strain CBS 8904) TaxID=1220162 RepID=K1V7C0_TRIAC|nr:hypothetical protein A1Q2_05798 [Trichosporon asahii var. asahii CBS 8904]